MNSEQLMEQVGIESKNGWKNSDLSIISEEMFEAIAEHFESCEECRKLFDDQGYESETLIEFEMDYLVNTVLSDWICEKEAGQKMTENEIQRMLDDEEEAARATLKQVDPDLPGLFQSLLESSEYNSETLYRVFMSHGNGAKDIVDYAVENELMPFQLLQYSEKKLSEHAEEAMKNLRNFHKRMSKDGKLPKKFKNGWCM